MTDVTGGRFDDDESVASEGDVAAPLRKRNNGRWIDGVERNKWGRILRTREIVGCQYTGITSHMKDHKAAKHGINVVWFSWDQDNCDYKAKDVGNVKRQTTQTKYSQD